MHAVLSTVFKKCYWRDLTNTVRLSLFSLSTIARKHISVDATNRGLTSLTLPTGSFNFHILASCIVNITDKQQWSFYKYLHNNKPNEKQKLSILYKQPFIVIRPDKELSLSDCQKEQRYVIIAKAEKWVLKINLILRWLNGLHGLWNVVCRGLTFKQENSGAVHVLFQLFWPCMVFVQIRFFTEKLNIPFSLCKQNRQVPKPQIGEYTFKKCSHFELRLQFRSRE